MKYYVVSDTHGFCSILKQTLTEKGFFTDTEPHKLIICGDLFDRGEEARELQDFILELMRKDEVILIRGNHEDLMLKMLEDMEYGKPVLYSYHRSNGTVDTAKQLIRKDTRWFDSIPDPVIKQMKNTPYLTRIIPSMIDYFETKNYIFVHGWIPCRTVRVFSDYQQYIPMEAWRNASPEAWNEARWTNGMEAAHAGIIEEGKTIVCGHWHSSFGHAVYEGKSAPFGPDADVSPYFADGIIAIDACTAYSGTINCLVIEDEE
ncbi:MAG: metallophosphoesterase [Clostridia bacterium]|nr:metallophosphoesterase [Clostridia bacterium]